MLSDTVVTGANLCQMLVPLISLSAYVPQWRKFHHTRSSEDVSLRSWCVWTVSSVFGAFYAIVQVRLNGRGWPLVMSTGLTLLFVILTVAQIVRYRRMPPPGRGQDVPTDALQRPLRGEQGLP